jgi:hypothetical protein
LVSDHRYDGQKENAQKKEPKLPCHTCPISSLRIRRGWAPQRRCRALLRLSRALAESATGVCFRYGQRVAWEIVELKKSSAFVQVRPVEPRSRKPLPGLVRQWDTGIRELERSGRPPKGFKANSLGGLQEFVQSVPSNAAVTVANSSKKKLIPINATMQRRVEEAVTVAFFCHSS